jgi:CspA family cold shock protein
VPTDRTASTDRRASTGSASSFEEIDDFPLEEEGVELKLIGEVKWFNRKKGYGFLTKADGQEVFFHRSDVAGRELEQIKDGSQVEFQIRRTDKGLEAFNVSVLPGA